MQDNVDAEVGTQYVLTDIPGGVGLVERGGHSFVRQCHLAPDIEETLGQPSGVTGDQTAFDQLMRIALHQQPVFIGAGLGLVAIDHQVPRPDSIGRETPFGARGEARAAATQQGGITNVLVDITWRLGQRGAQPLVTTRGQETFKGVSIFVLETRGDYLGTFTWVEAGRPWIRADDSRIVDHSGLT